MTKYQIFTGHSIALFDTATLPVLTVELVLPACRMSYTYE